MKRRSVDIPLAVAVTLLLMGGMVMVFSASSMIATFRFGSLTYFFQKQIIWGAISLFFMVLVSKIDYRFLKSGYWTLFLVLASILLLAGLFVLGRKVNGAIRWYNLGFMRFQPSEFAKLSLIIYASYYLATRERKLNDFKKGLLPIGIILGLCLVLIIAQPDLSSAMMILMIVGLMIFISPVPLKHLIAIVAGMIPVVIFFVSRSPYQWGRVKSWWIALYDPGQAAYQLKQSLIGIGRGGIWGQGLGQSKQKFLFLPDSHTDFIFSILGEEFGYIGVTVILVLFLIIFYRGMRIAARSQDRFGRYLAIGVTLNITLYAFINAGVVSALFPTTGLPMPFFSYGGSNLLFLSIAVGLLLNISRHASGDIAEQWANRKEKQQELSRIILTAE
ncbi:MAG: putative lipid II flippase FtsW [Calditrichaeota bacterium]|nr:putative lipid II flippase FtsW [Calditrichota bacterium]